MIIPSHVIETRQQISDALIDENDRDRRYLLTRTLVALDWLTFRLKTSAESAANSPHPEYPA